MSMCKKKEIQFMMHARSTKTPAIPSSGSRSLSTAPVHLSEYSNITYIHKYRFEYTYTLVQKLEYLCRKTGGGKELVYTRIHLVAAVVRIHSRRGIGQ